MRIRFVASFLSLTALLGADTLTLKNGSTINGSFVGGDGHSVRFEVGSQVNTFDLVDIDSLRFTSQPNAVSSSAGVPHPDSPAGPPATHSSSAATSQAATPAYSSSSAPTGPPSNSNTSVYAAPAPVSSGNAEVPSGTQIVVRLIDSADSQRDRLGQTYRASMEQPVVINGQTLIPRGADAVAVLSDSQKSGKIEGKTMLTIALRSVSVNGQTYDLATSSVNKASGSRTTKSGEVIGGTAALGAIIGALAGGGRGAAIGAVSGGAVGTGVQVATSGERVKIPAETVLTFALQNPLYIQASNN